jgi:hypothetical protein
MSAIEGGGRTDRAGPASEGKRTATGVRGGPNRSIKIGRGVRRGSEGVRAVRSRSDGGNQSENDEWLRMALIGGPRRVRRACAKRYPAV